VVSVVEAVLREVGALGGGLEDSALAATAEALAQAIDAPGSATSKAMVAKELRETLAALRDLAPPKIEEDEVDRARRRRDERLARQSASGATSPS
jgi:hypothetical protein